MIAIGKVQKVSVDHTEGKEDFAGRIASNTGDPLKFPTGLFQICVGSSGHQEFRVDQAVFERIPKRWSGQNVVDLFPV